MDRLIGLVGIALLLGLAWLFSTKRSAIRWKTVAWGLVLQLLFALFVLKVPFGQRALEAVSAAVTTLIGFADQGSFFLFRDLVGEGAPFIFAFQVLPIVIFISSFFSVLYYLGIMQMMVLGMAKVMTRFMGVSGAESLGAAANVFMGQTEAPIVVAPYIKKMTDSELMALMTGGMATVSGAILGGYIGLGVNAQYLIAASVMAAPGSLVAAKMLIPETEHSLTAGKVEMKIERTDVNIIDAAARGAGQGLNLALNIGAMLIAFVSIIYLLNGILGWVTGYFGAQLTMQEILGYALAPLTFLMGVPWEDANSVGQLIGLKIVLNEFLAYDALAGMQGYAAAAGDVAPQLGAKAEMIATYALCGFANFSSIAIQIGGIGGLAPERKSDLARLGLRAVLGGSIASFITATLAGIIS
ncbi:MAG TPA: NupC/NupG family nucleoside CNT transporter [Acidobacteriota bacterium]|nr:NupC/NupG family nucleoside CNT transporter [Acidobacteriota bacterium]